MKRIRGCNVTPYCIERIAKQLRMGLTTEDKRLPGVTLFESLDKYVLSIGGIDFACESSVTRPPTPESGFATRHTWDPLDCHLDEDQYKALECGESIGLYGFHHEFAGGVCSKLESTLPQFAGITHQVEVMTRALLIPMSAAIASPSFEGERVSTLARRYNVPFAEAELRVVEARVQAAVRDSGQPCMDVHFNLRCEVRPELFMNVLPRFGHLADSRSAKK